MKEQLMEIAGRIRELREVAGMSVEELAATLELPTEEIERYESGVKDIPIGYLTEIARVFGVEIVSLITGEKPRLHMYTLCRKDTGVRVERNEEYDYQALAHKFMNRKCEPYRVQVEPSDDAKPFYMNTHDGQEFDLVLSGTLKMRIEDKELLLYEGDCVYYDSNYRHGFKAVDGPAEFLAVVLP